MEVEAQIRTSDVTKHWSCHSNMETSDDREIINVVVNESIIRK